MTIRLRQIAIGYLSQKSALLLTALKSYVYELGRPTISAAVQTEQGWNLGGRYESADSAANFVVTLKN